MMWTDTELDQALADQPAGPAFSPEARARALAKLREADVAPLAEVTPLRRRHRGRWIAAAAAAAAVVGGTAVFVSGGPVPAVSAAALLDQAANGTQDVQVGPGQYRYSITHNWTLRRSSFDGPKVIGEFEDVSEMWKPANIADEWMLKAGSTGRHTFVVGDEALLKTVGGSDKLFPGEFPPKGPVGERAWCGEFRTTSAVFIIDRSSGDPCVEGPGSWFTPNSRFIAALPRDSHQLYDKLRDAAHDSPALVLDYAGDLLRSDAADRAFRSIVYRALMLVPGIKVTDGSIDLDGQHGVALGVDDNLDEQHEIILDPSSGRYIGDRLVQSKATDVPAGTVIRSSSVRTAVVDKIGVAPK